MRALDGILFDMGGTLDGCGGWRGRFGRLFERVGLAGLSHAQRMGAFDYAEERSHSTADMANARLRPMVERHVGWQLEHLDVGDPARAAALVDLFVQEV